MKLVKRGGPAFFEAEISEVDARLMVESVTLPSIEFVLQALKDKVLPSEQQVEQYLASDLFRFDSVHTVTRSVSGRVRFSEAEEDTTMLMAESSIRDSEVNDVNLLDQDHLDRNRTIYHVNNATSGVPWKLDLNNTSTVKKLMTATEDIRQQCLQDTVVCVCVCVTAS